ncbi:MAG: sigma-70 family RNA polymerase sigma factor [Clostridium sp.]|nr:sigma-70 family RNA polymerase sigma factor [Clostridium sp.]MEE0768394.1 sigma-70 family RNA polymerase sigma factor [Clostridia bacterium]
MEKSIEYKDDIVFANYINYMRIALLHKRIDYLKHKKYLLDKEISMSNEEWEFLSNVDNFTHSFLSEEDCKNEDLERAIEKLTQKQKKVIIQYYYQNKNLKEIANGMNITESAVSKLKNKAIEKLKDYLEVENEK